MLTRSVVPNCLSVTNTSIAAFVSPETKFDADERNATNRPSSLTDGDNPPAAAPDGVCDTRVVPPNVATASGGKIVRRVSAL